MKIRTETSLRIYYDFSELPFVVSMAFSGTERNFRDGAERVFAAIGWINDGNVKSWGGEFKRHENRYIFYFKNQQDAALFAIFWGGE